MIDLLSIFSAQPDMIEARILLSLVGIGVFTYYDLANNKNIPAEVCYAFLGLAIVFTILFPSVWFAAVFVLIFALVFTVPFYFAGQIGGADIFAMASLAILLPVLNNPILVQSNSNQYSFPVLFNTLLYAFFFFIIYMLYKFVPKMSTLLAQGKIKFSNKKIVYAVFYGVIYGTILFLLAYLNLNVSFTILGGMLFAALATIFFVLFREEINSTLVNYLELSKITEEDVLATEMMEQWLVSKYKLPRLLKARDLETLKRIAKEERIDKFPIYTGYPPFMPFIAIGFLLAVLFGNLFLL